MCLETSCFFWIIRQVLDGGELSDDLGALGDHGRMACVCIGAWVQYGRANSFFPY